MSHHDEAGPLLQRIAAALEVAPRALQTPSDHDLRRTREAWELMDTFNRITDRKDREACISFVRTLASRKEGS